MAAYVLVHGAWYGAWCWREIVPLLEAEGHHVDAIDLPGHGDDASPVAEMTLERNARRVADSVEAAAEPVVLVGHSMGGMAITQAAELVSDRIARLVYVCAFLPSDGQALPDLAAGDPATLVTPNMLVDEEHGTCVVAPDALQDAFLGECSDEAAAFALSRFVPESLAAVGAPVHISDARAGSVRRVYVECVRDRAIGIEKQRAMVAAVPCERVFSLEADHSPFLSTPRELADALLAVAP
jgi:pimeloyl-ACP methyl ester carboxylesterase